MKEWIPIPGSNKEKIIKAAIEEFSLKGYQEVNIAELANKADMTTGAIYHHFGSKAKLYEIIRMDMEQRMVDRMEGAASLFDQEGKALEAALITGLNFSVKMNLCKLLSEEKPYSNVDKIEEFITNMLKSENLPLEIILISSWRSILNAISKDQITHEQGRDLVKWLFK
ncbi:helix-turn-helix transcriptional regulator [Bacillus sp. FJAT-49732]|uniref:Helix-turn-helix transcriptional regulator n=1 Tax=Lederbergia citrisecunda TaxID=2833583 RepID=A0A942YMI3_9BACI|nr:helix-turn-helix domain-containing protein [Lederbergia citrisecunda]MBS4201692.1 helix-turn-helix transcriptional regulator [Lederbergia citrisecunda]